MITPRLFLLRLAAVSAAIASLTAQSQLVQGQIVLAEGDACPGLPGVTIGNGISTNSATAGVSDNAIIDVAGNLLFRARIAGPGVTLNTTDRVYLFGRTRETLQIVLRSGDLDPTGLLGAGTIIGTATGTGLTGSPRLSPVGNYLMFSAALSGPSIITTGSATTGRNDTALLWGTPGALTRLAQRSASFTTVSNGQTYQFDTGFSLSGQTSAINSLGVTCFSATVIGGDVVGTTNNLGWLTGTPNNLDWVVRKNDIVPIATGNNPGTFAIHTTLGFNCMINLPGQILHDERLLSTGTAPAGAVLAATTNDSCLFRYTPGLGNELIMREGDQAAGAPAGALYGSPTLSQGFALIGQCGFTSTMTGAVTTADDSALFMGSPTSVQMVAREGDQAPGLAPGVLLGAPSSTSSYSDYAGGSIAFYCALTGAGVSATNDTAMILGRPGNLQVIAREGDPAPGFENNVGFVSATFGDTAAGSGGITAGTVHLNDRGQMQFGNVTVTVVDGSGTNVLTSCNYSWDPTVGLKLLFARNDVFNPPVFSPQACFTAGSIQFASGEGSTQSLNSDGDLVMRVGYTSGNGHGALVRTKLGSLDCSPSALSATLGGVQPLKINAGVANANQIYAVVASVSGTRPGFAFGGFPIPLNFDSVTQDSINGLNFFPGVPWGNTLGLLDATGRGTATFTMPAGFPTLAGIDVRHAAVVLDLNLNVFHVTPPCGALLY